jgi:hypothetical protein
VHSYNDNQDSENESNYEIFSGTISLFDGSPLWIKQPRDRPGFKELYAKSDTSQTKWTNRCNWKLHIEYKAPKDAIYYNQEEYEEDNEPYSGDPLYDFLFEKGYEWKPSTFTIYVGSKDEAKDLADELIEKFGEYLKPQNYEQPVSLIPREGDKNNPYYYGDTPFDIEGKITGRFCGANGDEYREKARGFLGLPFLKSFSDEQLEIITHKESNWYLKRDIVEKYGSEQNAIYELTKVMDKMYDSLEDEFGEFFTGTDENRDIGYHPGSLDEFLTVD